MKKQHIKNLRSKVIFISLAIISSFLLIINFIPFFGGNVGITTKYTRDLYMDRVAYVNQSNPDMNYYGYLYRNSIVGNSCELFVHFNLQLLPKEKEELYFTIEGFHYYSYYLSDIEDVEINLILVESNWNYSEINWNNKPKHEEIIETVNASKICNDFTVEYYDFEKTVDLIEFFEEGQLSEISFCINITENNAELKDFVYLRGIKLLYSYEQFLISYTTIISSTIIFIMLIGIIFYLRKGIYYCPNCNTKRNFTERMCSSCQKNFEDEMLRTNLYYQRLIILLWIFSFFEINFLLITVFTNIFYLILPFFGFTEIYFLIGALLIFSIIIIMKKISKKAKNYRELKDSIKLN